MTEGNYNYRTSQTLLRNQFPGKGKLQIPIIPKFQEKHGDFDDLLLIGLDKTHLEDQNHLDRMVHFFLYDYRFERVWKNPDSDTEKLSRYRAVLSPDFSMYLEMAKVCQLYNVFRNRWCGAYWASKGIRVIPTVNWSNESTFDFCKENLDAFRIAGTPSLNRDAIELFLIGGYTSKGGGSAYGGDWKPSKPSDKKFIGEPGEIKQSFIKKGDLYETHIGPDGRADSEIHHSDHGTPKLHDNPHTHDIYWDELGLHPGKIEHPGKAFMIEGRCLSLKTIIPSNTFEDDRFKTISDFKWCMKCGGEVQFEWNGIMYCCFGCVSPTEGTAPKMMICQTGSAEINTRTEKWCDTVGEILEYMVGKDRLRDIIAKVKVWERTI